MAKGKCRNATNRNLGNMAASEQILQHQQVLVTQNTAEKQDLDLKITVYDAARRTQKGHK